MGLRPSRFKVDSVQLNNPLMRALRGAELAIGSVLSLHKLDVAALEASLWMLLDTQSVGFAFQLRQRGQPLISRHGGWAMLPNEGQALWSQQTPMMIASLSKLFTAVAAVRFLDDAGIGLDAKISPYLPGPWVKGPGVGDISFRDLLTHRSGLNVCPFGEDRIANMRAAIADGKVIAPDYRNVNFTLIRLLMYLIHMTSGGNSAPPGVTPLPSVNTSLPVTMSDDAMEAGSIEFFDSYTQFVLFEPAGVAASFAPPDDLARYYTWPNPPRGVAGVDERLHAGASGWCLSADDALRAMAAFRRRGVCLTRQRAGQLLTGGFGIDMILETDLGPLYAKNGGMSMIHVDEDGTVMGWQQCVGVLLPADMELVVFVNSNLGSAPLFLMTEVTDRIVASIRPWSPLSGSFGP